MSIIIPTISKVVIGRSIGYLMDQFFKGNDVIWEGIQQDIAFHQSMIEGIYLRSLKTCQDFLDCRDFNSAANSLMDLSNQEGTATINYILGILLYKVGNKELAVKKLEQAFLMNPLLSFKANLSLNEIIEPISGINLWSSKPYTLEDSWGNKAMRHMGIEINEGIGSMEVCTLGGNIAYLLRTKDTGKTIFGGISLSDGHILWPPKEESTDNGLQLVLNTPKYAIFKYNYNMFRLYSMTTGKQLAQLSEKTFKMMFGDTNARQYLIDCSVEEYSSTKRITIPNTSPSKQLVIIPERDKLHKYWKTDGNHPHPGIDFDPVKYYAMNIKFRVE